MDYRGIRGGMTMAVIFSKRFVSECIERSTYFSHVRAPLFRTAIKLPKNAEGEICICGLGFYDLFVNGEKITKGYLAPYISNPDHLIYYDHYDISPWIREGENVVGIMLGDGFLNSKTCVWEFDENRFNAAPRLAVTVTIRTGEETVELDAMDFRCKKGPVWFNDLRSGVFYDKRLEDAGWNLPGYIEDEEWHMPVSVRRPGGEARLCTVEPVRVTKELKPVRIFRGRLTPYEPREDVRKWLDGRQPEEPAPEREGGWIYDFGENNAGIFRLRIKGRAGQRIDIQCAEILEGDSLDYNNWFFFPDGYVQRDLYIVGGGEEEVFEPMFTYHGYRYLYVSGIDEAQAVPELLTYLVMSSELEERGGFCCSDPVANRLFEMARRSDISNFYYFPTDCPHREKNGWTGDAQASAEHMILTIGAERSWKEWLLNIRKAQTENGNIPGVVPTDTFSYGWGSGPAWDRVLFELPGIIYRYRGDLEVVHENAHAMLAYLEYISRKRNSVGIVAIGLGDWIPVDRSSSAYQVPLGFTDSVMVWQMCRDAKMMFDAAGLRNHARFAEELGRELRTAVREQYLDLDTMLVRSSCQSAQAMGLYYDIFESGEKPAAFARLLKIIRRDGEKLTCGFLGTRVLFHVLAQGGEEELAYRMIVDTEYPAYGYFAANGDTTLPERFLPDRRRQKYSLNHHLMGDIINWFMRYPGGIHVLNDRQVRIQPVFLKELKFAKAWHDLPEGRVEVYWERVKDKIMLKAVCPDTVRCSIEPGNGFVFEENGNAYLEQGTGKWLLKKYDV